MLKYKKKLKIAGNAEESLFTHILYHKLIFPYFYICSLSKHLSSKKGGSRTSNCGNCLEFSVLTRLSSVP